MLSRGITTLDRAREFFGCSSLSDPLLMKDMESTVDVIRQALDEGKKITVYGDYDCDGVTSTAMLYGYLDAMGAEVVYNHADYRLISSRALQELAKFREVNIFLRGMVPLVGFKSTSVYYERSARAAGKSHYPLSKMLALAFAGITSLSIKPIKMIFVLGLIVALISFVGIIWAVVEAIIGNTVSGWASTTCIICFLSGVQLISIGVIGEYIGKIYMEVKHRPRYIISEKTWKDDK